MNARHVRWEQLMQQNKGQIDVELAEKFLADHLDTYEGKEDANERSLCGHTDHSSRGVPQWDYSPYAPEGAVQGKVTSSALAGRMKLIARAGHPCGEDFLAKEFLDQHSEYNWEKPVLRDMKSGPWTTFWADEAPPKQ